MNLFSAPIGPASDVWTVTDLTSYIRELFEIDFRLREVRIAGEISNFSRARSGHLYFTLKDEAAQIKCVMWRTAAQRLTFHPESGDAVLVEGRVTVYEAGGVYQLYAEQMEPAGRGDLAQAFEALKQRLDAEGLFAPERKKPIPRFPRKIGIVTSADAAALRDILNVLRRRCPLLAVLIAPTLVQGPEAPRQIVHALQWLDGRNDIDTIIIARGGGSMEDLWAFNDESVARAISAARHPIICGVGHEVDFTIVDFVADLRAPTPSAAAELVAPDLAEVKLHLASLTAVLPQVLIDRIGREQARVQALSRTLRQLGPMRELGNNRQRVDTLTARLEQLMARRLERAGSRLALAEAQLMAVGPLATLSRGYAIVRRDGGPIIRRIGDVNPGESLRIQVVDGEFGAIVDGRETAGQEE